MILQIRYDRVPVPLGSPETADKNDGRRTVAVSFAVEFSSANIDEMLGDSNIEFGRDHMLVIAHEILTERTCTQYQCNERYRQNYSDW